MHPASASIRYFGVYVVLTGLGLLLAPAVVLNLLGLPVPTDQWVRVLGALAIVLGYYYWMCGSRDAVAFFGATVAGRGLFAALCVFLVVLFGAPMQLLLFALIDLLGAAWTAAGLRKAAAR